MALKLVLAPEVSRVVQATRCLIADIVVRDKDYATTSLVLRIQKHRRVKSRPATSEKSTISASDLSPTKKLKASCTA